MRSKQGSETIREETAAGYEVSAARTEAVYGNFARAREGAKAALARASTRGVQTEAALTLALAGDSAQALALANDLARRFPEVRRFGDQFVRDG